MQQRGQGDIQYSQTLQADTLMLKRLKKNVWDHKFKLKGVILHNKYFCFWDF